MLPTSICNLDDFNDKLVKLEIILQLTFIGQLVNKESISALPKIMQTLIKWKESQWIHFSFKKPPLTHFRIWIKVCVCVCVCMYGGVHMHAYFKRIDLNFCCVSLQRCWSNLDNGMLFRKIVEENNIFGFRLPSLGRVPLLNLALSRALCFMGPCAGQTLQNKTHFKSTWIALSCRI